MKGKSYEMEIRCLLAKDKYNQLLEYLSRNFKMINEDSIHTMKFVPGDVRLRKSDKIMEIVCKEPDITRIGRKEIQIPIANENDFNAMHEMLLMLGLKTEPGWIKHKKEFLFPYDGYNYTVCLQNVENFAYIMEVEFMADIDDSQTHESNLKAIARELGCEPINPDEFLKMVEEYKEKNKTSI